MQEINFEPNLEILKKTTLPHPEQTKDCKDLLAFICADLNSELVRETKVAHSSSRTAHGSISCRHAQSAAKKLLKNTKLKDFAVLNAQKAVLKFMNKIFCKNGENVQAADSSSNETVPGDKNPRNDSRSSASFPTEDRKCRLNVPLDKMNGISDMTLSGSVVTITSDLNTSSAAETTSEDRSGYTMDADSTEQEMRTRPDLAKETDSERNSSQLIEQKSLPSQRLMFYDYREGLEKLAAILTGNCSLENRALHGLNCFLNLLSYKVSEFSAIYARAWDPTVLTQEDVELALLEILPPSIAARCSSEGRMAALLQSCGQLSLRGTADDSVRKIPIATERTDVSTSVAEVSDRGDAGEGIREVAKFALLQKPASKSGTINPRGHQKATQRSNRVPSQADPNEVAFPDFQPGILELISYVPDLLALENSASDFLTNILQRLCVSLAVESFGYCEAATLTGLSIEATVRSRFVGKSLILAVSEGRKTMNGYNMSLQIEGEVWANVDSVEDDRRENPHLEEDGKDSSGSGEAGIHKTNKRALSDSSMDGIPLSSNPGSENPSNKRVRVLTENDFNPKNLGLLASDNQMNFQTSVTDPQASEDGGNHICNHGENLGGHLKNSPAGDIMLKEEIQSTVPTDEELKKMELGKKQELEKPSTSRKGVKGRPRKLPYGQFLQVIKYEVSPDRKVKTYYLRVVERE